MADPATPLAAPAARHGGATSGGEPTAGNKLGARHPPVPGSEPGSARANLPPGFIPSADEPWRPLEPQDLAACRINATLLSELTLRLLLSAGESAGKAIADELKLPFRIVEPLLLRLKQEQSIVYNAATATNDYVYGLTEAGRQRARSSTAGCSYVGPCPVALSDYVRAVGLQSIERQTPKREDLQRAFADLLIPPTLLDKLGPAINSGRGMFLYGDASNGKTSIAERITAAFGRYIWVPRAIDVGGAILRLFDPLVHQLKMPAETAGLLDTSSIDKRWVRIQRPTLVAGGELTLDMLEVRQGRPGDLCEAPLQLKSNCGTLVIDDFGRQRVSGPELLNRWIVPLEKRHDFLSMANGMKIQVPFDQMVIFSTNLEPRDLVDDAFLRRIPYKIEVSDPSEADFRSLFALMCQRMQVPLNADAIDYLIDTHYRRGNRRLRNCHPRDLLMQVKHRCAYHGQPLALTRENLDFAVENYFSIS